ncbi:MAG: FtsW/RodA/SpoVE family cell cycle protein, partial [Christensenellaceae bacterium]|nr:FtsW/RodA/SpoVE family cell cycle protein [Christensenellaceae bacterium]
MKLRFIDPRMFKHIDWLLFANIMALILFSLVAIASAVSEPLVEGAGSLSVVLSQLNLDYVVQQLTWLGVGLFAMFVVLLPDYHAIGEYYKWIYTILIILLVAVLLFGKTVNGTKGWFRIGNSGFQPSEIGKVAIIILLARMISDRTKGKAGGITKVRELLPILGAFLLPLALIIAQPDFGTAMVYVFTFFTMLFLARTSLKLLLGMVGCVCAALPAAWLVLADWQKNRIYSFLGI